MLIFCAFYLMFICLFSYLYFIMECEPGRNTVKHEPPADYPGLSKFFAIIMMTFRNSIGDLAPPDYAYWIIEKDETTIDEETKTVIGNGYRYAIIHFIWFIWLL